MPQADVTDNTPVHVLGGNILPIGGEGSMTTTAARASPLTLLVALTTLGAQPPADRCSGPCTAPQARHLLRAYLTP